MVIEGELILFFWLDEKSKLGGGAGWALFDGASWSVLFKWAKMKCVENERNELMMMGIGIFCIFHSFPLKKCSREDFFVDFFDFQKNTCYLNTWPISPYLCHGELAPYTELVGHFLPTP